MGESIVCKNLRETYSVFPYEGKMTGRILTVAQKNKNSTIKMRLLVHTY